MHKLLDYIEANIYILIHGNIKIPFPGWHNREKDVHIFLRIFPLCLSLSEHNQCPGTQNIAHTTKITS